MPNVSTIPRLIPSQLSLHLNRSIRPFSSSPKHHLRTSELTPKQLQSLRANPARLWSDIHSTARWGTGRRYGSDPNETGLSRLTLSDADKCARDWFIQTTQSLSCKTHVDAVGNIFAVRPGLDNSAPATFVGSHLDSQPNGGRFDGVLGVAAGIEMLRVLDENWIETEGPVGVVNWTNEEGARWPLSMMGSGVWAGYLGQEKIYETKEVSGAGRTVRQELERIGYVGDVNANWESGVKVGAHFELHIEQGKRLEKAGEKVGVVEGVQGYKWFDVIVEGRDSHTGTTMFEDRADALWWASKLVVEVRDMAKKHGGLASVGIMEAQPGSVNTVPGRVKMILDVRHRDDGKVDSILEEIETFMRSMEQNSKEGDAPGIKVSMEETFASAATKFHPDAISCAEESAKAVLGTPERDVRKMTSGAGHDSVWTNKRCPTAMVFVPCRDGVSHAPDEWCEEEDCAVGTSVLLQSVLRYDRLRHKKGEYE